MPKTTVPRPPRPNRTERQSRPFGSLFVDSQGLRLSPAYDLNPSIERRELSLAFNEVENACDVDLAMEACGDYGLTGQQAEKVLREVRAAIAPWRREATSLGISRSEQELMAQAFEG